MSERTSNPELNHFRAERERWLRERDSLRATLAALQLRCAKLEAALETAKQFAVCNCPEDEETGRVTYHSNCQRRLMPILLAALAPDAGTGVSKEGYEGLGFGPKIEGYIKKP